MTDPKKALKRKNTHFADDIVSPAKNTIDIHKKSAPVIPEPKSVKDGKQYLNPRERAKRELSIRHRLKDSSSRSPSKSAVMVVRGPAGGYSQAKVSQH
jgi:hypothetical protein